MNNSALRRLAPNRGLVSSARPASLGAKAKNLPRYADIDSAVAALKPAEPLLCFHPDVIAQSATQFLKNFPGQSYYAVKSNPDPYVLTQLYASGIRHFDVASLGEVKQIRSLFNDANLAFMHPVKGREAIRAAYFDYGVRVFVLDSLAELRKIQDETRHADDLTLVVRLAMPKGSAACSLAGKFGIALDPGVDLLRETAKSAAKIGISFHVGSQTLDPQSYADAIRKAGDVARKSGVTLDVLDIGGGFPVAGLGMEIPPLTAFFDLIKQTLAEQNLPPTCAIWCEPGRALSGGSTTLITRVELRKDDVLYLNDGSFGNMFEVCSMQWRNDARRIRPEGETAQGEAKPFRFFGPTCDSVDYMPGPFTLPDDIAEGDWIALSGMGAYGSTSRSTFNGFDVDLKIEIRDPVSRIVRLKPKRKEG